MDRMKTLFKYFLMLVLLYVFSNIIINALLKTSFKKMENYEIDVTGLYVDVSEAKVSRWSGKITGIVKNNTDQIVTEKYLKITMLSKNGNNLGEKYVKISKLEPEDLRNFEVSFEYSNVKSFKIELTDTIPEEVDFFELLVNNVKDVKNDVLK